MTPEEFFPAHAPYARAERVMYGGYESVFLAQSFLESAAGTSELVIKAVNYHGIKAGNTPGRIDNPHRLPGVYVKDSGEYRAGWTVETSAFLTFASPADAFLGHGFFLRNRGLYGAAFTAGSPEGFIRAVHAAGYATDPDYSTKVVDIINRYGLRSYDTDPAPAPKEPAVATNPLTPDELLAALRAEGLTVHEVPGWRDRCRCHNGSHERGEAPSGRPWGRVRGTMVHITAGGLGTRTVLEYIRDIINGDPITPNKCHFVVDTDGEVWLNSAGRANHAGGVSRRSLDMLAAGTLSLDGYQDLRGHDADGNVETYGIENIAATAMNDAQRASSVKICAAISRTQGWSGVDAIGHGEASDQRSYSDPNLNMGFFRRDVRDRVSGAAPAPAPVPAPPAPAPAPAPPKPAPAPAPAPVSGPVVYVSKLRYGQRDSDSVRLIQQALNKVRLNGGTNLPVTGNYLDQTKREAGLFQTQKCGDPADGILGPKQARFLLDTAGMNNVKVVA